MAGTVLVHKLAGAAAERGLPLAEVAGIARGAAATLGSMGVALGACIVPAVGKPGFDLGENEIEFGLGIHGEKGVERTTIRGADQIVDIAARPDRHRPRPEARRKGCADGERAGRHAADGTRRRRRAPHLPTCAGAASR